MCKLRNLVALRGQKSKKIGSCESKVACKFSDFYSISCFWMFNWQPFLDLINSKDCTHEYYILNFSDLKKVAKTFFKNTKYQSEKKKHNFLAKEFWSQCHILRIIYVLYMYYICIIYVLYVYYMCFCWLLLAFLCFFCVRGDFCMCFCWLLLAFLGFFASAAIFVCAFAGFIWLFLGFLRPRRWLATATQ